MGRLVRLSTFTFFFQLRRTPRSDELRREVVLEELEEGFLIGSDIVDRNEIVARTFELADALQVWARVGPADDRLDGIVLAEVLDRRLEEPGRLDFPTEVAV